MIQSLDQGQLEPVLKRVEKTAGRPAGAPKPQMLHHYTTGQSPNESELPAVWLQDQIHGNIFVATFQADDEASMSAAALNRARPFEAPIVRKLHEQG